VITSNPGKVKEYREVLTALGIETEHLHMTYDEVQSSDLEEVVSKGMEEVRRKGIRDFIIDDSGLFIDSLGGFPGVWSAYVQKTIGNRGVLKLMECVEDRRAEFRCCIGCDVGGRTTIVTGKCRGLILPEEAGCGGFGFDPIFSSDGETSFADIAPETKNRISHRGDAIRLLLAELGKEN
jgi:XTP/dITP diphosphohydrolase